MKLDFSWGDFMLFICWIWLEYLLFLWYWLLILVKRLETRFVLFLASKIFIMSL